MNFAQWVENEMTLPLPDAKQFSYIACVLDEMSQTHLESATKKWFFEFFGHDVPPSWSWRCHHMTVLFRQGGILTEDLEKYRQYFGDNVVLHIKAIVADDNAVAALVRPNINFPIQNPIPHITIAHSKSVSPVYSNSLLLNREKFHKVETVDVNSVFAAVKKNQTDIWPEKPFKLASPVKS